MTLLKCHLGKVRSLTLQASLTLSLSLRASHLLIATQKVTQESRTDDFQTLSLRHSKNMENTFLGADEWKS